MFIASALMISSLSVFAKVEVKNYNERKEFEQYVVQTDKAGKVTVNIDREIRRVDCHGLSEKYTYDMLSTGEIIVNKQYLMHTMMMCPPGTDYVATSGISFTVEFKESYGGSKTILVPANSKVIAE